jgi:hypothetical protein
MFMSMDSRQPGSLADQVTQAAEKMTGTTRQSAREVIEGKLAERNEVTIDQTRSKVTETQLLDVAELIPELLRAKPDLLARYNDLTDEAKAAVCQEFAERSQLPDQRLTQLQEMQDIIQQVPDDWYRDN